MRISPQHLHSATNIEESARTPKRRTDSKTSARDKDTGLAHSLISWLGRLLPWICVRYSYKGVLLQNVCVISHQNACPAGLSPTGSHSASCPPKYNLYFNTVLKSLPNLLQSRSYVKFSSTVASE